MCTIIQEEGNAANNGIRYCCWWDGWVPALSLWESYWGQCVYYRKNGFLRSFPLIMFPEIKTKINKLLFEQRGIKNGRCWLSPLSHITTVRQVQIVSPSSRFPAVMEMQIPATLPDKWDLYLAAHRLPPLCIANGGAHRGCRCCWVKHTTRGVVEVMQTSKRNTSAPLKHVDMSQLCCSRAI